jgi:glycosyltransferase involved in cell wall biosynthesis
LKIVYIIDHLRADGTQRVLCQLVEGLAQRGHQQVVFCLNDSSDSVLVDQLGNIGVLVKIIGRRALAFGYGGLGLWLWLHHWQCDALVTMLFFSDVFGRTIARAAGVPYIITTIRARNTNYARWQFMLVRVTMRWADRVILNSNSVKYFATQNEAISSERTIVIPNGVDAHLYDNAMSHAALKQEFCIPEHHIVLGSVGRLTYQKGFDLLISALAKLETSNISLLLIGAGEEQSALLALSEQLGVADRVHFAGYRRDVSQLLGALDIYVHPARFEGMPNALLEAMAAGCTIVATNIDGNHELIENDIHGWLAPVEDAEALASYLQQAISSPVRARRLGDAARHRAIECFSITAMIDAWEQVLLSGPSKPPIP